jgi:transcriptional regulator with XRE-family HTH domain
MTSRSPGWPALTARQRLGARLRGLRELAGLRNEDLAAALKVSPATISRIEAGDRLIKAPEVDIWGTATGAGPDMIAEVKNQLHAAVTQVSSWSLREAMAKERPQVEIAALEQTAATVLVYDHAVVHGLLQVRDYARRVFELADVGDGSGLDAKVDARLGRQAALLDQDRRFVILMTEAALRWRPGAADLQRTQLDRILAVMHLPNVEIGILPLNAQVDVIYPEGFHVYTDRQDGADTVVVVELITDELTLADPTSVDLYVREFGRLKQAALFGDAAVQLLGKIRADLQ